MEDCSPLRAELDGWLLPNYKFTMVCSGRLSVIGRSGCFFLLCLCVSFAWYLDEPSVMVVMLDTWTLKFFFFEHFYIVIKKYEFVDKRHPYIILFRGFSFMT